MTETVKLDAARPNGEPLEPTAPALLAERVARALVFAEAEVPESETEAAERFAELAEAEDLPGVEDAVFVLGDATAGLAAAAEARRKYAKCVARGEKGRTVIKALEAAGVDIGKAIRGSGELKLHYDHMWELDHPDIKPFGGPSVNDLRDRADKLTAQWWGGEEPEALATYRADVLAAVRAEYARLLADPVVVAQVDVASATAAMERLTADPKVVSPAVVNYVAAAIRKALGERVLAEAAKPKRKK